MQNRLESNSHVHTAFASGVATTTLGI